MQRRTVALFDMKGLKSRLPKHRYSFQSGGQRMPHMTYAPADLETVDNTRHSPENFRDLLARGMIRLTRGSFDLITRYDEKGSMTKDKWVNRAVFLETVAGVPGMVAGMVRHLNSLRRLKRDHGWIHHLLEEAENERMHLFFFLREKNPGVGFRTLIGITQVFFFTLHFLTYLLSPKFMHRFVGYLEEEAVHTYTVMLKDIDAEDGPLREWSGKPAPDTMIEYYALPPDATYRDVILCIRADELGHREYNHLFAEIHNRNENEMENCDAVTTDSAAETPKK